METKNHNPIQNVTWKGAKEFLEKFVDKNIMAYINKFNLSERDTIKLLGVGESSIYLAKEEYIKEYSGSVNNQLNRRIKLNWYEFKDRGYNWCTIDTI